MAVVLMDTYALLGRCDLLGLVIVFVSHYWWCSMLFMESVDRTSYDEACNSRYGEADGQGRHESCAKAQGADMDVSRSRNSAYPTSWLAL